MKQIPYQHFHNINIAVMGAYLCMLVEIF